jgi:hypothetical protein
MILGQCSAGAGQFGAYIIAGVGVQSLFQGAGGQPQSLPSSRHFQGFEIQLLDGLRA